MVCTIRYLGKASIYAMHFSLSRALNRVSHYQCDTMRRIYRYARPLKQRLYENARSYSRQCLCVAPYDIYKRLAIRISNHSDLRHNWSLYFYNYLNKESVMSLLPLD